LCLRYPYIKLFLKIVHFGPNTKNSVSFYLFIGLIYFFPNQTFFTDDTKKHFIFL